MESTVDEGLAVGVGVALGAGVGTTAGVLSGTSTGTDTAYGAGLGVFVGSLVPLVAARVGVSTGARGRFVAAVTLVGAGAGAAVGALAAWSAETSSVAGVGRWTAGGAVLGLLLAVIVVTRDDGESARGEAGTEPDESDPTGSDETR